MVQPHGAVIKPGYLQLSSILKLLNGISPFAKKSLKIPKGVIRSHKSKDSRRYNNIFYHQHGTYGNLRCILNFYLLQIFKNYWLTHCISKIKKSVLFLIPNFVHTNVAMNTFSIHRKQNWKYPVTIPTPCYTDNRIWSNHEKSMLHRQQNLKKPSRQQILK